MDCFFHILGYDIWFYISHILLHTRIFWNIHKIHHTYREPTWLDTYKGHWIEGPFQSIGFLLPFAWGSSSLIDICVALLFVNGRGMARHDARTKWVDGGHHLIHHKNPNVNYGEMWLDRLFGTLSNK